jgi:hypothetical protein
MSSQVAPSSPELKVCAFCQAGIHPNAKKCPWCLEWAVPVVQRGPTDGLAILGGLWMVVSVIGGIASVIAAAQAGSALYLAIGAAVVMQGLLLGLSARVLATLAPWRPEN